MTASDPSTLRQAQGRPEQVEGRLAQGRPEPGRGTGAARPRSTFFSRLFESELMPPGLPQVRLLIWSAAPSSGPGVYLPVNDGLIAYLARCDPRSCNPAIWGDKLQLLLLAS